MAACAATAEMIWPGAGVTPTAGRCAEVKVVGDEVRLKVVKGLPDVWPAVYFNFAKPTDLTKVGALKVTLTNRTGRAFYVGIKVKGRTLQGRLPEVGMLLPANENRVKNLSLFAEKWAFDKPHGLVGLKRNPGVGAISSYSLEKVSSISVYLPSGTSAGEIGVLAIEALPGDNRQGDELRVLKVDTFFPWVDEFGQANYAEWNDKVRSLADLRAKDAAEDAELAARPCGIPDADEFGGWATGPQLKATGFFRTEKVKGKWWFVDPCGRLFLSQGVNMGWNYTQTAISQRERYFEKLPPNAGETKQFWSHHTKPAYRNFYSDPKNVPYESFSFSKHNLYLKYGKDWREKDVARVTRRLRSWGINVTTGTDRELRLHPNRVPYVVSMNPTARPISGMPGYWGFLSDPFAPEFAESCRREAECRRAAGTNAWCVGWTANNEQSWGVDGEALARGVLASSEDQPARIALMKLLAARGKTPETATRSDLLALGEAVADRYYSTVRAAVKAVAPNHLYMGDRNDKSNPEVYRAASRHCDVITVNIYDHRPTRELPPGSEDKPFLVTEFHFGCYDTGYFYASLIPVRDQTERAECYRTYLRAVIDSPNYIGAHWFQWRDCPITGVVGECANAQCGFVSMTDVPYAELIGAVRDVSAEMYTRRYGK